jgi:hypothetical protein
MKRKMKNVKEMNPAELIDELETLTLKRWNANYTEGYRLDNRLRELRIEMMERMK